MTMIATGGYGRAYFTCTGAHTQTGDGNAMVLRAGLPLQDMEFVQFHPTGIYGAGCLITEGVARRRRLSGQFRRRALHGALRAVGQGPCLARRGVARHDHRDPRRPRRRQGKGPHLPAPRSSRSQGDRTSGCRASAKSARIFAGVDVTREPIPVLPTVHYNMGGIATQLSRRGADQEERRSRHRHPRPDGAGRSGLRLGARRQPARLQFADRSGRVRPRRRAPLRRDARRRATSSPTCRRIPPSWRSSRLDKFRHAAGGTPTAQAAAEDAEGDAEQLRRVPHRRGAGARATS